MSSSMPRKDGRECRHVEYLYASLESQQVWMRAFLSLMGLISRAETNGFANGSF